jgi:predicted SAM-dependent methyltransferase
MLLSVLKSLRRPKPSPGERRLHIGGVERTEGWEVLNALAGPVVDHVGSAADLRQFADGTFSALYSSHVLEHLDYKDELHAGLREWHRVLAPGGRLYVSVPDLAVLAKLFLTEGLSLDDRLFVVRMIFGGHVDAHDYHQMGFDFEILATFLREAGFVEIERVADLGLFDDTSRAVYAGVPISVNVTARKAGG